jgi:cell division cycle protein 37
MDKANQRIKMLERDLKKIIKRKEEDSDSDDDDDDDDDDLDDTEAIKIEIEELKTQIQQRQVKLDDYEKNKKWNVDNMSEVKEERTVINKSAGKTNYTPSGYAEPTVTGEEAKKQFAAAEKKEDAAKKAEGKPAAPAKPAGPVKPPAAGNASVGPSEAPKPRKNDASEVDSDPNFVYSYHEFTEKYADLVEQFMDIKSFEGSKEFILKHGDIVLQEHASNYLLLASLEDEMNGYRDKMKQTAKQSQIVTNIAELAKGWNTHPGNAIIPFFNKMQQREFLDGFMVGLDTFVQKIIGRAVTKKMEMDEQRRTGVSSQGVDLTEIPKEERLGPGGLDPLEVIETLPIELQEAFESRDVEQLKKVLLTMSQTDAEYHMKRCVDSGLWQA